MYRPVDESYRANTQTHRKKTSVKQPKERQWKLAKWKKMAISVFVVYALFVGQIIYSQEKAIQEKQQEVDALLLESKAIQSENEKLQQRVERLDDEDYIAEIARQNYYLSKPGEVLFIVPQNR